MTNPSTPDGSRRPLIAPFPLRIAPGIVLCAAIAVLAYLLQMAEARIVGHVYVADLVIAILLGAVLRMVWQPGDLFWSGIHFSSKTLLEVAVALLGASISFQTLATAGLPLVIGIAVTVALGLVASYTIGRACGLPVRMAVLVACGNSICGNSAIAAVAPIIGATGKDVATAIAFTAVLGVVVVFLLPFLAPVLEFSQTQYGIFAGLTVYAVPQVLAATAPIGAISAQVGTLVKLVRVLLLGPLVIAIALVTRRIEQKDAPIGTMPLKRFVPWFIIAFLLLALLRSFSLLPELVIIPSVHLASLCAVVAMAALGLEVDLRAALRLSGPVTVAVTLSLLVLMAISYLLIRLLGIV